MKKIILILLVLLFPQLVFSGMKQKTQGNADNLPINNNLGNVQQSPNNSSQPQNNDQLQSQNNNTGPEVFTFETVYFAFLDLPTRSSAGDSVLLIANVPDGWGIRGGFTTLGEGEAIGASVEYLGPQIFSYSPDDFWSMQSVGESTLALQYSALRPRLISFVGQNCSTPPDIRLILNGAWGGFESYQYEFPLILINCYWSR
jgi:hypothetical protein